MQTIVGRWSPCHVLQHTARLNAGSDNGRLDNKIEGIIRFLNSVKLRVKKEESGKEYSHWESNPDQRFRKPPFYPLNYESNARTKTTAFADVVQR